jgi:tRNA(Ile)-lysidine synthase
MLRVAEINWPAKGKYVLAVSGGADSMVLLDLMTHASGSRGYELTVAHFDHGLRPDSAQDRRLVERAAAGYGLAFEHHEAHLGRASEAAARTARYRWLAGVKAGRGADAIVTAHHQDDLVETSLLNLARGTGRRGLAPLHGGTVLRPLLAVTRRQLREYAGSRSLSWREDATNADTTNPRNYLRHRLLARAPAGWHAAYLANIEQLAALNNSINQSLASVLASHRTAPSGYSFPRQLIRELSLTELEEIIHAAALGLNPAAEPSARAVRELALFAKTGAPHRFRELTFGLRLAITPQAVSMFSSLPPTKSAS